MMSEPGFLGLRDGQEMGFSQRREGAKILRKILCLLGAFA